MWYGKTKKIKLPSGFTATLKNADLLTLGSRGVIPIAIISSMQKLSNMADGKSQMDEESFSQLVQIVNAYTIACFVDPKVTENGEGGSVSLSDVPFIDKLYVLQISMGQVVPEEVATEPTVASFRIE